jgi:hypothetical protein
LKIYSFEVPRHKLKEEVQESGVAGVHNELLV